MSRTPDKPTGARKKSGGARNGGTFVSMADGSLIPVAELVRPPIELPDTPASLAFLDLFASICDELDAREASSPEPFAE